MGQAGIRGRFLSALVAAAFIPAPFAGADREPAFVDAALAAAYAVEDAPTVVLVLDRRLEAAALGAVEAWGLRLHRYPALHMAALRLPHDRLDDVARLAGVEVVWSNEAMRLLLDRSGPYIGANILHRTYHVAGAGVSVLVVDTGVDGTHPDTRYGENLVENVVPTREAHGALGLSLTGVVASDADGHGTHVAGIVGGTAQALGGADPAHGRFRGVAPAARLVGFAAGLPDPASGEPRFESVSVLEAFNYALERREALGIRVVTNSWGANGPWEPRNPVNLATLDLYRAGLVVLFAAGNEGEEGSGTLNKYSVAPWVLSVGAGDYLNRRAAFSSIGTDPAASAKAYDHPDLLAPGVQITSAKAAAGAATLLADPLGATQASLYVTKSGTSMATPHAAAAAALLLSDNPALSPDNVYDLLTASATPLPGLPVWEAGAGYLNALGAYRLAQGEPGELRLFQDGQVKYGGRLTGDDDYSDDAVTVGLHNRTRGGLGSPGASLGALGRDLVGTPLGLTFVGGGLLLASLAFRLGRRHGGPAQ